MNKRVAAGRHASAGHLGQIAPAAIAAGSGQCYLQCCCTMGFAVQQSPTFSCLWEEGLQPESIGFSTTSLPSFLLPLQTLVAMLTGSGAATELVLDVGHTLLSMLRGRSLARQALICGLEGLGCPAILLPLVRPGGPGSGTGGRALVSLSPCSPPQSTPSDHQPAGGAPGRGRDPAGAAPHHGVLGAAPGRRRAYRPAGPAPAPPLPGSNAGRAAGDDVWRRGLGLGAAVADGVAYVRGCWDLFWV